MLEKEFKVMISQDVYETLVIQQEWDNIVIQNNYYYDTPGMMLDQKGITLRVRKKEEGGNYYVQLKVKQEYGDTGEVTCKTEQVSIIDALPSKITNENLKEYGIVLPFDMPDVITFICLGSLRTTRYVKKYETFEVDLDKNEYLGKEDYELEVEFVSYEEVARKYLLENGITPERNFNGKRERFVLALKNK